mgnify:CR=1 FL=1|tara:strand:- start:1024 stop:1296 length:273 start_codon:yes stop_codon:yes gene_type:complete
MEENLIKNNIKNENKNMNYLYTFISMVPVVSSALCAVYVVMMYSDVQLLIKDFNTINNIINTINTTKLDGLLDGIIKLENCVLTKLPICS